MKLTKSREELAFELGISTRTLSRWLKKKEIILENRLLTLDDQIRIYENIGMKEKANALIYTLYLNR